VIRLPRMTTEDIRRFWEKVDEAQAAKYAAKPRWEKRLGGERIIQGWWTTLRAVGRML